MSSQHSITESESSTRDPNGSSSVYRSVLAVAVLAGLGIAIRPQTEDAEPPALVHTITSNETPVSMAECRQCHEQEVEAFEAAPHLHTLWKPDDPLVVSRFDHGKFRWPTPGTDGQEFQFQFDDDGDGLKLSCDALPESARFDWVLGSGRHAMTPVELKTDADGQTILKQLSVTWYPGIGTGVTLGQDPNIPPPHDLNAFGEWLPHAEAKNCLGCHATHLPVTGGVIDEARIIPGVRCARCHENGREHIRKANEGSPTGMVRWSKLSPRESINRCGECHRRADQLTKIDLDSERKELIRFASVGLVMSPCFHGQDESESTRPAVRLDCLACHDPHRPAESAPDRYVEICNRCHAGSKQFAPDCSSSRTDRNCLPCHMPGVEIAPNLTFTDHWIRVRSVIRSRENSSTGSN
ncbi:MAG: multiheme c-type cytochrome [Planctomycetota bacterium]|nr:multiheme c-type cytochrome [Planctomycetota bacterium]